MATLEPQATKARVGLLTCRTIRGISCHRHGDFICRSSARVYDKGNRKVQPETYSTPLILLILTLVFHRSKDSKVIQDSRASRRTVLRSYNQGKSCSPLSGSRENSGLLWFVPRLRSEASPVENCRRSVHPVFLYSFAARVRFLKITRGKP